MKSLRILFSILSLTIMVMACGGGSKETNRKNDNTPVASGYGFFRNLQPKTAAMKIGKSASNQSVTMSTSRSGHRAIEIGGGKFMLIGGECGKSESDPLTTPSIIDIFNSTTETFTKSDVITNVSRHWRSQGDMSFALVKLPNGKILIIGGAVSAIETLEIYDPVVNSIELITNVFSDPVNNVGQAFYVGNNKVLFIGTWQRLAGDVYPNVIQRGNAVLDLTTMKAIFIDTPVMVYRNHAVQLADNSVIYAGGEDDTYSSRSEIWKVNSDLTTNKIGNMNFPRQDFGMTLLSDGNIGIYGGINVVLSNVDESKGRFKSVEIFNTTTNISTLSVDLLAARCFTTAVQLQNDFVLNAGGADENGRLVGDEFVHNHITKISGTTGNLNIPRMFYSVIPLNNGRVLISGGDTTSTSLNSAEIYDPGVKLIVSYDTSTTVLVNSKINFTSTSNNVVWSVSSLKPDKDPGTISSTGVYTAPAIPVKVIVTGKDGVNTASITITVMDTGE